MSGLEDRYSRVKTVFGDEFEVLRTKKVLLFGVGGVGSFCLDALYRSGITDITIVDFDKYDITNQNRQIGSEALGEIKVDRLAKLYNTVTPICVKVNADFINSFDFSTYDIVLDAIDDVKAKALIARKSYKKLISSMGSARKIDPTKIECLSIWKTYNDPLAKKLRDEFRAMGFKPDFKVIFSSEPSVCEGKGSFVGVTGAFGLALASKAIERLIKDASLAQYRIN